MAENIHIDLSEEIEQDLLGRYQSLSDDLTQRLNAMYGELEEMCNRTQYEPMLKVVNNTITLFNEEIYGVANQAFEEWKDGEGSFCAAVENSQAGEAAMETARQIETGLRDLFDTFWSSHPLGELVQLDTSRPKIKEEDYEELKEIYIRCFQEIETIGEENLNQILELGGDDPTYNVIVPAVKAMVEPIKEAFEQFGTKVDEAKEESINLKQQQDSKNEEASENATQTSASAADIAEALQMFDDI